MQIKFIAKAKLTKQGQITLPREARQDLNIETESELYWYQVDDHLIVVKELMNQKDLELKLKKRQQRLEHQLY